MAITGSLKYLTLRMLKTTGKARKGDFRMLMEHCCQGTLHWVYCLRRTEKGK
jgi:hypothetical protein